MKSTLCNISNGYLKILKNGMREESCNIPPRILMQRDWAKPMTEKELKVLKESAKNVPVITNSQNNGLKLDTNV